VNPLPATVAILDVFNCEPNSDGVHQFDLDLKTLEILNGRDPLDFQVTYQNRKLMPIMGLTL
jgi:hypothetical protein